ncbi:MAG: ribonuclease R family protein [Luteolibacter sp.]
MSESQLRADVLDLIKANPSLPVTKSLLARRLQIPVERRSELRRVIESLIAEGVVEERKKACFSLRQGSANRLVGTLKFHPKGHAFFFVDPGDAGNLATGLPLSNFARLQISRRDAGLALDGDRVLISIQQPKSRQRSHARGGLMPSAAPEPCGRVEKVLARRSGRLVGIYRKNKGFGWIECTDKAVDGHIDLIGDTTAQAGQLVVVDMSDWQDPATAPRGRVIEVLGWPGGPGVDIISVIHRYGLRTSFPDEVLAAARAVPEEVDPDEIARREDWRKQLVITIDPADAKDHDDAIWLEKSRKGWRLAVHIADVSHYIKPDSVMDKEAVERGNSTYLVDRVLPMLPVELSNGICSLKPNVDRLTKCALMEVLHDGQVASAVFVDAVIHSRAKLSYEQAQQILDGGEAPAGSDPDLASMVREAWKMAAALRRRRFEAGALDLEMPEIKVRLDADGRAVAADPVIHTESHQLIEECMLAANDAVAKVLRERMKPAVYRIHEDPDPSRLMDYTETAMLHGYRPGDLTNRDHIQKLLDQSKGTPEEHIIKLGLLKSLKRAAYAAEPIGHYGLAKTDYCHFTSPIRRYADLIVHRALQPLLRNPPKNPDRTPSQADLREISRHISDTERNSAEAENETKQIKLFEYLQRIAEMHDPHVFDGLVTDVRPMGLMIEIPDMAIRGVVKREDLPPGRWRLEGHRGAWVSADGMVIAMGMRVPLHVVGLDLEKRFVDFSVAGPPTSAGTKSIGQRQSPPPRRAKKQVKRKTKRRH